MTLAAYTDANAWIDEDKIRFENDPDALPESTQADAVVKAALIDLYPDHVSLWDVNPTGGQEATPALVKTIASLLMASYRYAKKYSEESTQESGFALYLANMANGLLADLREGRKSLADVPAVTNTLLLQQGDFWPNNLTTVSEDDNFHRTLGFQVGDPDRAFTMDKDF